MSIDSPTIPPESETKSSNKLLWGCLIAFILALVVFCCAGSLIFLPLFSDFDPLGTNLRGRIEEYLPLEYLEDPSSIPGMQDFLDETPGSAVEGTTQPSFADKDAQSAQSLPLADFYFNDIDLAFSYPVGWDIELDVYTVTFYDPDSFTYLYMGEDTIDAGSTAEGVALDVLASVQEGAQAGTFELYSSAPYEVAIADDAYLTLFEWVDEDGYYTWAYDLEIVYEDSNLFFFFSGEDPDQIAFYGELLDIIASSLYRLESTAPDSNG
ncbi:MAG: hypothetical protein ACK2TZ_12735 [Anaerolineales bacterium]